MDLDTWLLSASADARRRGLDALVPLLEALARSTRALRAADEAPRVPATPPQDGGPRDAS